MVDNDYDGTFVQGRSHGGDYGWPSCAAGAARYGRRGTTATRWNAYWRTAARGSRRRRAATRRHPVTPCASGRASSRHPDALPVQDDYRPTHFTYERSATERVVQLLGRRRAGEPPVRPLRGRYDVQRGDDGRDIGVGVHQVCHLRRVARRVLAALRQRRPRASPGTRTSVSWEKSHWKDEKKTLLPKGFSGWNDFDNDDYDGKRVLAARSIRRLGHGRGRATRLDVPGPQPCFCKDESQAKVPGTRKVGATSGRACKSTTPYSEEDAYKAETCEAGIEADVFQYPTTRWRGRCSCKPGRATLASARSTARGRPTPAPARPTARGP